MGRVKKVTTIILCAWGSARKPKTEWSCPRKSFSPPQLPRRRPPRRFRAAIIITKMQKPSSSHTGDPASDPGKRNCAIRDYWRFFFFFHIYFPYFIRKRRSFYCKTMYAAFSVTSSSRVAIASERIGTELA